MEALMATIGGPEPEPEPEDVSTIVEVSEVLSCSIKKQKKCLFWNLRSFLLDIVQIR